MNQSIATIDSPEFINLQPLDLNPGMSKCEIKVLYVGENRNHSFISKEVAVEMSKTLRGAPIVGYYKEDKEDFRDHGHQMTFDGDGIHFDCLTKPYGFVAPDAEVWFQKFDDKDEFGNITTREYLMTYGYLWTGQFEECADVVKSGRPQSMELDSENLDGHWATNSKTGIDFFIINDATFTKLCILGNDVEPCFEGASVVAPAVSSTFSAIADDKFRNTLFSMMQDLKKALEGGQNTMEDKQNEQFELNENNEAQTDNVIVDENNPAPTVSEEFKKDDEEDKKKDENKDEDDSDKSDDEDSKDKEDDKDSKDEEDKKKDEDEKKKYSLLEENYNALQNSYNELQTKFDKMSSEYDALVAFKKEIEDGKKDELIASFYMLSDEDKADVIAHKSEYSYDEIESKLAVICWNKKISFTEETNNNEQPALLFSFDNTEEDTVPAWIKAVENTQKNRL